jgi:hypothetical protein
MIRAASVPPISAEESLSRRGHLFLPTADRIVPAGQTVRPVRPPRSTGTADQGTGKATEAGRERCGYLVPRLQKHGLRRNKNFRSMPKIHDPSQPMLC